MEGGLKEHQEASAQPQRNQIGNSRTYHQPLGLGNEKGHQGKRSERVSYRRVQPHKLIIVFSLEIHWPCQHHHKRCVRTK